MIQTIFGIAFGLAGVVLAVVGLNAIYPPLAPIATGLVLVHIGRVLIATGGDA